MHRNRTQVCVLDRKGNEVRNRNVTNDRQSLRKELTGLRRGTPIAFEAAYGTGWIAELLGDLGFEPHLAHPSGCRAIADAKLKNDRVDARTLANLLRTGYLAEAWLAPKEVREQRPVAARTGPTGTHPYHGQEPDPGPDRHEGVGAPDHGLWTKDGAAFLERLDLSPMHRWVVTDCQVLIDVLETRISLLEAEIRRQAGPDKRIDALMAIPGIGDPECHDTWWPRSETSAASPLPASCAPGAGIIPSMRELRPHRASRAHHEGRTGRGARRAR